MPRVPDRKKLRREYLKRKGKAYSIVIGLVLSCMAYFACFWFCVKHFPEGGALIGIGVWFGINGTVRRIQRIREQAIKAKYISYVPPVTPDTLPAEEVLVRGAEEPQAADETLVRPSAATEETAIQELLRSNNTGQPG